MFPHVAPRVCVVPNGVSDMFFDGRERAAERAVPLHGPFLLWVGMFKPHKDPATALDVLARVHAAGRSDVRLAMVGRTYPELSLPTLVAARGLTDAVVTLGEVDDDTLRALYRDAAALIFPSRAEGFGLPVAEAMAAGLPVVGSNLPSLVEIAGNAAALFEPGNVAGMSEAVLHLLRDSSARAAAIARGRARVAGYRWEETARVLAQILTTVRRSESTRRTSAHAAARAATFAVTASTLAVASGTAGCSPCDGVLGCTASPRLALSGEFATRDIPGGPPVPGVRVEVVSRSPAMLIDSVARATSDATGWWSVSMRARTAGYATVDVIVTPPAPDPPFRVSALEFPVTSVRGVGAETGRWVPRPFISYVGMLRDAATDAPIVGAQLTVARRGGVSVTPTSATDTTPKTDGSGQFVYDVKPATLAPLYVDFYVDRPGLPRAVIPAIVTPGYEWGPPHAYAVTTFTIDSAGHVSGAGIANTQRGAPLGGSGPR